jgi:ECF transporter S component (folate family)
MVTTLLLKHCGGVFIMHKNNKQHWNVVTLVYMALFVALNLVLTRVLVLDLGAYRVSLGSVVTIMAGLWLGPVAGGVCGFCSDILGCFIKGYAVNPFITVAAILWGVLPALAKPLFVKRNKTGKMAGLCVSVFVTAVLSTLIITTAGLVLIMGYNFYAIMPGRLIQFVIMIPIYCVLTCLLYFSPLTAMVAGSVAPQPMEKKAV